MVLQIIYEISVNYLKTVDNESDDIFSMEDVPVLQFKKVILRITFNPMTEIYSVRYIDDVNNIFCDAFTIKKDAFIYIQRAMKLAMQGKLIYRHCRSCDKKIFMYDEKCYCPVFQKYIWKAELKLDHIPKHLGYTTRLEQTNLQRRW